MGVFRYRVPSDNSFNALLKNELWIFSPNQFNDPYDSSFSFDINELSERFLKNKQFIRNYCYLALKNEYPNEEPNGSRLKGLIDELSNSKSSMKKIIKENSRRALKLIKDEYLIGCFSRSYNDTTMWAHYAEDGKGFVVEYDEGALITCAKVYLKNRRINYSNTALTMVEYSNEVKDGTDIIEELLISYFDFLYEDRKKLFRYVLTNENLETIFARKTLNWSYENEYRIILPNSNLSKANDVMGVLIPIRVYAGANMEPWKLEFLKKYCENNCIPLFKMTVSYESKNNGLIAETIYNPLNSTT